MERFIHDNQICHQQEDRVTKLFKIEAGTSIASEWEIFFLAIPKSYIKLEEYSPIWKSVLLNPKNISNPCS